MEQEEFSALSNDKTIVIKLSDKEGAVANVSRCHYQSMIMQKTKVLHLQQYIE